MSLPDALLSENKHRRYEAQWAAVVFAMLAVLCLSAPSALGQAEITTIGASCPFDCGFFSGWSGLGVTPNPADLVTAAPVAGGWDAGPYVLTFTTAAPTSYTLDSFYNPVQDLYTFTFLQSTLGSGGSLQIIGPDGFLLSGTFTGGGYSLSGDYTSPSGVFQNQSLNLGFTGRSNNGESWSGGLSFFDNVAGKGSDGGFTMQVTPEPSSWLLFGTGLLGVTAWHRKRWRDVQGPVSKVR